MRVSGRLVFMLVLVVLTSGLLAVVVHAKRERPRTDFGLTKGLIPVEVLYYSQIGQEAFIERTYLIEAEFSSVGNNLLIERPSLQNSFIHKGPEYWELKDGPLTVCLSRGSVEIAENRRPGLSPSDNDGIARLQTWTVIDIREPAGREVLPKSLLFRLWNPRQKDR